jgi:hypothetical protein
MEQALSELRAMQAAGCVLLGDPAYYARFGLQLPGVPPGYLRWPCMGQAGHRAQRCLQRRRLSQRRRRRSDSAVGLEHRARPLPRPDLRSPRPGRNGLGAVLTVIPSSR